MVTLVQIITFLAPTWNIICIIKFIQGVNNLRKETIQGGKLFKEGNYRLEKVFEGATIQGGTLFREDIIKEIW